MVRNTITVASARTEGYINDHVDVVPTELSDRQAISNAEPSLRRYNGFLNTGFEVGDGLITELRDVKQLDESPRKYHSEPLFHEEPLEQALLQAEGIAKEENVVLYLLRGGTDNALTSYRREIMYKPDRWEAREG